MTSLQQTILFVIDDLELKYFEFNDLVTNFWIIKEFLDRDYEVFIAVKSGLMTEGNVAKTLCWQAYEKDGDIFYKKDEPKKYVIEHFDVVFFRPDPPVDIDYINACSVFDYVDTERTVVINNPIAVKNFNEKFHLNYFPEFAPENIVTASAEEIKAFVREHKKAIIKPLNQCFGGGDIWKALCTEINVFLLWGNTFLKSVFASFPARMILNLANILTNILKQHISRPKKKKWLKKLQNISTL